MEGVSVKQLFFRRGIIIGLTLFCLSALFSSHVDAAVNPTDLSTLNALASAWGGANSLNWGSGDPCTDRWQGVYCDSTNTKVTSLLLISAGIVGTIPPAIGSFSALDQLDLSYNPSLGGTIPSEIGQLTTLTKLIIQSCALTGPIPSTLSNLANLTFLALNNNQLTGEIPPSIGALQKVWWFDISTNKMSGKLPVSTPNPDQSYGLDTMAGCMHFHFNNNSFTGSIPTELGAPAGGVVKLTKLIHLLFESNQLNGSIPDSLANLTGLEILSLSNNQLSGPIPASLNRLAGASGGNLHQLLVGNNKLTGTLPNLTALSPHLDVLELSKNSFDPQPFPAWVVGATNLTTVYLENSQLAGGFPAEVLSNPRLQTLWARNNSLNGTLTIPLDVGPKLMIVSLQDNQLVKIDQLNVTMNLNDIDLQVAGNPMCNPNNVGRPTGLCDKLVGVLGTWTSPFQPGSTCSSSGTCDGSKVINPLNLGNCNCTQPLEIILESRRPSFSVITDELMETLRSQLQTQLNLLPSQVWITSASFTPDKRVEINIDFFSADGISPLNQAITQNITHSLTSQVLVLPQIKPYIARPVGDANTLNFGSKKVLSTGAIVGIVLGVLAALSAAGLYALWQKRRAERLKHMAQPFASWGGGGGEKDVDAPKIAGARWFSYAEVKKATNNFSDANEIGVGGYGKVYAGVLPSGEKVAVKRAQEGSMQGAEEFKNEIELLSRVHHKNLVGLVGYCYDQGEQMLVYEFMVNGTMNEWLAGKKSYPLDWSKRLSIAVGSARGLSYLHELANPPIIHRDIKSANILLDDKHVAKVADFGLSMIGPDGTDQLIATTQVKGTLGYLDPEYYMTQHLSEKSDVYSFGVVLLELLTSRAPIQHGKYIVREVRTALDKGGMEALEPLLDPSVHEASPEDLERFLDLALVCVEEKGADRPTMNEVVKELEALAQHNKPKAKASAQATDETWLTDVYGEDADYQDAEKGVSSSNFKYSGGYTPRNPEPK